MEGDATSAGSAAQLVDPDDPAAIAAEAELAAMGDRLSDLDVQLQGVTQMAVPYVSCSRRDRP